MQQIVGSRLEVALDETQDAQLPYIPEIGWVDFDESGEVGESQVVFAFALVRSGTDAIGAGILRINFDCFSGVGDGRIVVALARLGAGATGKTGSLFRI